MEGGLAPIKLITNVLSVVYLDYMGLSFLNLVIVV